MKKKISKSKLIILGFCFFIIFFVANLVSASQTEGTIDGTYKYAWGENIGWLNFACEKCNVVVTDSSLSGYVWSSNYGWINLNPNTSGVKNTAEGILSDFAWSSNLGWINFNGVTIDSNGNFIGYATIKSNNSIINFNCANMNSCSSADFKVKTDWRPASVRPRGGGRPPSWTPNPAPAPILVIPPVVESPIVIVADNIGKVVNSASDFFLNFFRPKIKTQTTIVQVPEIAPPSFFARWNLLPVKAIREFVFAPLPYEVRVLTSKFPELGRTLKSVGVERLSDMDKLSGVTFTLEGLSQLEKTVKALGIEKLTDIDKLSGVALGVPGFSDMNVGVVSSIGVGKISLLKGLKIVNFPFSAKQNLPTEFVFARASGELLDLNVALSVSDKGNVTQKISSLPGKTIRLVVKPISNARSVTGYFIFKSATPRITKTEISRSSLSASALFSLNDLVEKNPEPISIENKLVLSSFEYTDPDHDGIYTADVVTPIVPGEYEVITVIDYIDPVLGVRQMRMITVIDPEGYVFEKNNGKETRIPSAIVSLYKLNNTTKKYELWLAKEYQQENPQITDIRGTYSFLVPEGSYYFQVEAPGYDTYDGKVFIVAEGNGIHQNIELNSGRGWFSDIDWKTVLLFVVLLLLMYNLYRNKERDKLLKLLNKNE